MENIKQDIHQFINEYLSSKGGDIFPLDDIRLNNAIDSIAEVIQSIIKINDLKN
jgi:hypothetical protein